MNPFDHNYFLGYINEVTPQYVKVHFPSSVLLDKFIHRGSQYGGGNVGNYVVIEGDDFGFLARLFEVSIPDGERKAISEKSIRHDETTFHPTGKAELLLCFSVFDPEKKEKTVSKYPSIGAKVFCCSDQQIQSYVAEFGRKKDEKESLNAELGRLTSNDAQCSVSFNSLFGRHCAILGTTGGGKSWTVAKLIEEVRIRTENQVLLFDPTGEYESLGIETLLLGDSSYFHYSNLTVNDIFILLRPGGQVQAPKLLEAITSLKMLKVLHEKAGSHDAIRKTDAGFSIQMANTSWEDIIVQNGTLVKANCLKRPLQRLYSLFSEEIDQPNADFDITKLHIQITNECIWDTNNKDSLRWGDRNETHLNNCVSLILRSRALLTNKEFSRLFGFKKNKHEEGELTNILKEYFRSNQQILRVSFEGVSGEFQTREILMNAIGQFLLQSGLKKEFKQRPIITFIDEAHRFLNRNVHDEYFEARPLDAFDVIAKEGRKFGLFLCLATQMPRDIPVGTLSQIGAFIVHRLINELDRKAIESAASGANRNALSFLPILGEGEALLVGVDFPMPLTLKITEPQKAPDSKTPKLRSKNVTKGSLPVKEVSVQKTSG